MSSPPRYRSTFSPIRNLEERYSPSRNLDIIIQESLSSKLSPQQSGIFQRSLQPQSQYYIPKYSNRYSDKYSDTRNLLLQNDKLKTDNQILDNSRRFTQRTYTKQLDLQGIEVQDLRRQLALIEDRYQKQNLTLKLQNQNLKKTIFLLQTKKAEEITILRQRYSLMPQSERQALMKNYSDDMNKALLDLETAHILLDEKQKQLAHLSAICHQNSGEYGINLSKLISDNNVLKNQIRQLQQKTQKQIRQISVRKQLEKSRTQGIISYCKENTLYIQKQINRLADELLKKNISIQSFNRQVTKYQRLIEEQGKRNDDQIYRLKKQCEEKIHEKDNSFAKIEKMFKQDLAAKKKIQFELIQKISTLQNQVDVLNKKLEFAQQSITDKDKVIRQLKDSIQRKQQDHAKQISKVMSESKIRRKSMKNISSYSSFKDIEEAQGSSIIKSGNLRKRQSIGEQASSPLPIVRQEDNLAQSQNFPGANDQQFDIQQLVLHYESMIQELKKNKMTQLSISNNKIESLKQSLNQKQQEVLDILNRFSPLMEYNISQESIDEERRRKIEEHQKGDIDLLSVMLRKYDIVSLRTSRK